MSAIGRNDKKKKSTRVKKNKQKKKKFNFSRYQAEVREVCSSHKLQHYSNVCIFHIRLQ